MVTIDISIEDISKLIGNDKPYSPEELDEEISFAISEVDSEPEGPDENGHTKVAIDIKTSNRPDLWSAEGIARIVRGRHGETGLPDLEVDESGFEIEVDPDVKEIRPYIAAAIVKGLDLNDFLIKQLIQIQDKVDFSFGRKRKRSSIGIYNINMLESPIKYKLVERDFKFQPLQFEEELTVDEIFENHPKGQEYRHILEDFDQVPMLLDEKDMVLSMPPIINSNDVGRVTEQTTDVLVETTGTSYDAVIVALGVVVQALRDRGGKVESVKINYPDNYDLDTVVTPSTDTVDIEIEPAKINDYLGTDFTTDQMIEFLKQRRNDAVRTEDEKILVHAAPWRREILHWVDMSEEIAIAANYNEFEITQAEVVTAGKLDPSTDDENMLRKLFSGMQLIEVMNYTLSNNETLSTKINREESWVEQNCVEISNPVNSNYSVVRPDLLPGLLSFASNNTHVDYPHRIFETGECVIRDEEDVITLTKAAVLLAGANETYETILSVLDATFRLLKIDYNLKEGNSPTYILGRCADIYCDGTKIGTLGEIHPKVLANFNVEVPISAFEVDLTKIPELEIKSYHTNSV